MILGAADWQKIRSNVNADWLAAGPVNRGDDSPVILVRMAKVWTRRESCLN